MATNNIFILTSYLSFFLYLYNEKVATWLVATSKNFKKVFTSLKPATNYNRKGK